MSLTRKWINEIMIFSKKILYLAIAISNDDLDFQTEINDIKKNLEGSSYEICHEFLTRAEDMQEIILDHRPQILHLAGHGSSGGLLISEDTEEESKGTEEESEDRYREILGMDLIELLTIPQIRKHLECVLMNTCYSELQARLLSQYVDHVIGIAYAIFDESAISFSKAFYKRLNEYNSYSEAYEMAKNALDQDHKMIIYNTRLPIHNLPDTTSKRLFEIGLESLIKKFFLIKEKLKSPKFRECLQIPGDDSHHEVLNHIFEIINNLPGLLKYSNPLYREAFSKTLSDIREDPEITLTTLFPSSHITQEKLKEYLNKGIKENMHELSRTYRKENRLWRRFKDIWGKEMT